MKLILDDFGIFLGRKRERFLIRKGDQKKELPADEVESIILASEAVNVSASALRLAISKNVQVVFARYGGWPYAILMPTALSGSVRARREQFAAYSDRRGVELAKAFVAGKLSNQANLLKLLAKNRRQTQPGLADRLHEAGQRIDEVRISIRGLEADRIDDCRLRLMNEEAEGARIYWDAIRAILPEGFRFPGRETKGAKDPINSMLNFGYQVVLFPEVWKAISYAGLDPYAGYLHADRPGKPSMVLDLMEEFRQQVVDRAIWALVAKSAIRPEDVGMGSEGLPKEVLRLLASELEGRLASRAAFGDRQGELRSFIHSQARAIARFLLEGGEYRPFALGW
ncbi:MAG: CRISPR-associated endonuclease Cas1 [Candidatus Bathyarchaeia archaeon]